MRGMDEFLSTPSARRATQPGGQGNLLAGISIHALREEGDQKARFLLLPEDISIHALREEGDLAPVLRVVNEALISIHALREEGDH